MSTGTVSRIATAMPHTSTRRGTDIQIRTGTPGMTVITTAIERRIADRKIDWYSTPIPMEEPRILPGLFFCHNPADLSRHAPWSGPQGMPVAGIAAPGGD